jgi:DNA helicase HerA-like ATPase
LEKIEQVVKLIRSKGVGVYFITQNPRDIPDGVLAQLGNKVQHALHAYTPAEQRAAKAAAMSFRENPEFDTFDTLLELGIGEGLVTVLDENGVPTVVKRTTILPPQSQMGPISDDERDNRIKGSLLYVRYNNAVDRDSAYEFLQRKSLATADALQRAENDKIAARVAAKEAAEEQKRKQRVLKSVANSAGGTIGREIGNTIGKSIGGSFGKKLGGNIGASLGRGILSTIFKF